MAAENGKINIVVSNDNLGFTKDDPNKEEPSTSTDSPESGSSVLDPSYVKITSVKPQMNQPEYDEFYGLNLRPRRTMREVLRDAKNSCECSGRCVLKTVLGFLPFIGIMKEYRKDWIFPDVVAGLTIGIMQIPQGLAYASLASVEAVVGLYVSFFPVLLYYFFGTSRHISLGTFAVISLMVGNTVEKFDCSQAGDSVTTAYPLTTDMYDNTTSSADNGDNAAENACKLEIATALGLMAGLVQLVLGLVKLGFVVRYLSVPLTRGFTTGCSIHVFTSQIKHVVGIDTDRYSGPLKLVYTYRDIFKDIASINWAAVVVSLICIIILFVTKEYLNAPVKKRIKAPIPIDLIIVIVGAIASYYGDFYEKYGLSVVGDIPQGIPPPKVPKASLFLDIFVDAIFIAIIAFAISVSMVQLYADKYSYDIDPNQELVAHGICNMVSSNFNCYPMCVSLSRSALLDSIGVKTQVYALWSCGLILLVIYFIASYFAPLPNCVLAAIIIIALKGLFMQFKDIPKYWKISGTDLSVWLVTFIAVVLMDVGLGLAIGVFYCLITVVGRTQKPYTTLLGKMPDSTDYKDTSVYQDAKELPGVKVYRFENALYYANKDHFADSLFDLSGCNPKALKLQIAKCIKKRDNDLDKGMTEMEAESNWPMPRASIHHVIIDCSAITYTDAMGVIALRQVVTDFKEVGVTVFFAAMNEGVREMLDAGGFYEKAEAACVFPTIHDAVYDSLTDFQDVQRELTDNIVNAPYIMDEMIDDVTKPRSMTSTSKHRVILDIMQMEIQDSKGDIKRNRAESEEGYYNRALVIDDVMDIDTLDEDFRTQL